MYLGIDIGGSKTFVAPFSDAGQLGEGHRFPTPSDYQQFLNNLTSTIQNIPNSATIVSTAVAIPGLLDRKRGVAIALGNLPWKDVPIRDDISHILPNSLVSVENDARLAGLAEAQLLGDEYKTVLYLTISTGIGGALIVNGRIVKELQDTEMGKMPLLFDNKLTYWENFAGGQTIVERYQHYASDITDPQIWHNIAENIAYGLGVLCSILQPEVVIFGGGVGQYADKFKVDLQAYLDEHLHAVVRRPKNILAAHYKEESAIYGCYELAKHIHG